MYGVGNGSTGSWRDMQHGVWLTAIYCMYGVISSAAQVFAAVPVSLCVHASFLCGNMFWERGGMAGVACCCVFQLLQLVG